MTSNKAHSAIVFEPLSLVLCIARLSSHKDEEMVTRLEENNRKLYLKFQKHCHGVLHTCKNDQCPAEFRSIVINGLSSNHDMSLPKSSYLRPLHQRLEAWSTSYSQVKTCSAIIFSQQDGLFTNIEGFRSLFGPYAALPLHFFMYQGGSAFSHFALLNILSAANDIEAGRSDDTAAHRLVREWVMISLNKMQMSIAARDNKQIIPRSRNTIDESDSDSEVPPVASKPTSTPSAYSDAEKLLRRQKAALKASKVLKYDLEITEDGMVCCPESLCDRRFHDFDLLVAHIFHNMRDTGVCSLCPNRPRRSTKVVTNAKNHIRSHLPAQLACDQHGCPYRTTNSDALIQHKKTHDVSYTGREKTFWCDVHGVGFTDKTTYDRHIDTVHQLAKSYLCPFCNEAYSSTSYLGVHIRDWCKEIPRDPTDYECPDCYASGFTTYKHMAKHRYDIHTRREQIVGFALQAGILDALDVPAGASEYINKS